MISWRREYRCEVFRKCHEKLKSLQFPAVTPLIDLVNFFWDVTGPVFQVHTRLKSGGKISNRCFRTVPDYIVPYLRWYRKKAVYFCALALGPAVPAELRAGGRELGVKSARDAQPARANRCYIDTEPAVNFHLLFDTCFYQQN